jgi:hypothetical protein
VQVAMLMEKAGVFMATGGRDCDHLHGEAGEAPFPPPEACTRTEHDSVGACSDPNLDFRFAESVHDHLATQRTHDVRPPCTTAALLPSCAMD